MGKLGVGALASCEGLLAIISLGGYIPMFKCFPDRPFMTIEQILKQYPHTAYILANPEHPKSSNGVIELPQGLLCAIADQEGLDELNIEANRVEAEGHLILIDTTGLVDYNTIPSCWPEE